MSNKIIYTAGDRTPYTYLIGWQKLNKWYYGVRYAKGCHPNDFWVKYFTSSRHDHFEGNLSVKNMRKKYGEPDVIQIRKTFESAITAVIYEQKLLRRIKAVTDEKFLNRTCNKPQSWPGHVYVYSKTGDAFGYINEKDFRYTSSELVMWHDVVDKNGVKNKFISGKRQKDANISNVINSKNGYERASEKVKITLQRIDENGLTGYQRAAQKANISKKIVGKDGLNQDQRGALRRIQEGNIPDESMMSRHKRIGLASRNQNLKIDENGKTGYQRAAENANMSKRIVHSDGLTSVQRGKIKEKLSKQIVGDDGLTPDQRGALKLSIKMSQIDESGKTGWQRRGEKKRQSSITKAKKYDVYHINTTKPVYTNLSMIELKQSCVQFNENRDKNNYIGKFSRGRIELEKMDKLKYVGMYIEESSKESK